MVTDFVGRETELSELAELCGSARLVTVTGPGGVGKTRVARRAASDAVDAYPDGAWIVELSGLRDPELLANTVASSLGIPEQDARSPRDAVLDHLRDRQLLLVLDTCEHLIEACAMLTEAILGQAPGITLLITSRQPLDVSGEHVFAVPPLPPADAVELFRLRARLVVPGFTVDEGNRPDIARLCKRLQGIPLAIELAAVQLRILTVAELALRLERHLAMAVIAGTASTASNASRRLTLRGTIDWSYDLCSPAERALWQRLSVFAGWFDLAAVEEVCAESEPERAEVLTSLYGLVDKSVVLRESPASDRYHLLDTIREYGSERLAETRDEARWRGRHFDRYRRMAEGFRDYFASDEQIARYHRLRDEHDDIRAALEFTIGAGQVTAAGAGLVNTLALYWMISGRLREGGYWLGRVLAGYPGMSAERAATLVTRGLLRSFQGNVMGSIADCTEAIAISSALGTPGLAARAYLHMNLSLTFSGRHAEAEECGQEALRRLTEAGDRIGRLMLACQMGHLYQLTGQLDKALETCAEGLALLGPGSRECWLQSYLYIVASFALFQIPGRDADCASRASQALAAKHELGDIAGIAYALETLGWLSARSGRYARCAWLLGAADPLWERVGSRFGGTALMEQVHQHAVGAAAATLGPTRFDHLFQLGAISHVDDVVTAAIDGRDELAPALPGTAAGSSSSSPHGPLSPACRSGPDGGLLGASNPPGGERVGEQALGPAALRR